jgi:hypothetical protein
MLLTLGIYYTSITVEMTVPAIAQVITRRIPTAANRVPAQVKSCGLCDGQNGTGAGFLQVLQSPLAILIPPTAPHSSSIIQD